VIRAALTILALAALAAGCGDAATTSTSGSASSEVTEAPPLVASAVTDPAPAPAATVAKAKKKHRKKAAALAPAMTAAPAYTPPAAPLGDGYYSDIEDHMQRMDSEFLDSAQQVDGKCSALVGAGELSAVTDCVKEADKGRGTQVRELLAAADVALSGAQTDDCKAAISGLQNAAFEFSDAYNAEVESYENLAAPTDDQNAQLESTGAAWQDAKDSFEAGCKA
jgi:hypothetical protein